MTARAPLGRVRLFPGTLLVVCCLRAANARAETTAAEGASAASAATAGEPASSSAGAAPKKTADPGPHFIGIPIPIFNPQFGFALGGIAMLTYPLDVEDTVSPPSATTLFGMYSSNQSWLLGGAEQLYWGHDDNRAVFAVGGGHFNSDFYGTGDETSSGYTLPLGTTAFFVMPKYMRRIIGRFYLGGKYQFFYSKAVLTAPDEAPDEIKTYLPLESNDRNSGLGVVGEYDSRDNRFSATQGFYVPFNMVVYSKIFGGTLDYGTLNVAYNSYHDLYQKQLILALRAYFETATSNTPFYLLPSVGVGPDLRGYASGRYRDRIFMATQAELRWYFWQGFGAVIFGGVGSTTGGFNELFKGTVLPSYGGGLRYMLHRAQRLVMRLDYGHGNEDGMLYFSVSEAF